MIIDASDTVIDANVLKLSDSWLELQKEIINFYKKE